MSELNMDQRILHHLENLESVSPEQAKIVSTLREYFFRVKPNLKELIMYGGLVYKEERILLWGLFARKNYVTLDFGQGFKLDDPYSILEGTGKERRHIRIWTIDDIEEKKVRHYINESAAT